MFRPPHFTPHPIRSRFVFGYRFVVVVVAVVWERMLMLTYLLGHYLGTCTPLYSTKHRHDMNAVAEIG